MDTRWIGAPLFHVLNLGNRVNGRLRGLWLKTRIRAVGGHVGARLSAGRAVQIVTCRGASWQIGDRVSFGAGVVISVGKSARFTVGHDVRVTHYTVIGAENSICIADRAQIGEHCSIRDHDHDASANSMHDAGLLSSPVRIGEDSWVGRGVAVLRGSHIGAGAVIGANAVVRGDIPKNAIAVGMPARVIRSRR
jgi:serine acetyltransferase